MTLDDTLRIIGHLWPHIIAVAGVLVALGTTAHIVLFKSDVRAAIGWAGLVWLAPFIGAILYWLLGINRIRRRAGRMRRGIALSSDFTQEIAAKQQEAQFLPASMPGRFAALATAVGTTSGQALMPGNTVEPLVDTLEPLVDGLELRVDLFEPLVDAGKAYIHLLLEPFQ